MYILSFHLHKSIFKKLRPREVNYSLKATQLASGRARIRPRQACSRHAHLGTRSDCLPKGVGRLDKPRVLDEWRSDSSWEQGCLVN